MAIIKTTTEPNDAGGTNRLEKDCSQICLVRDEQGHVMEACPLYGMMGTTEYCLNECDS